jgi:hypothetical protein
MKIHFHNRRFRLVALVLLSLVLLAAFGVIQTARALEIDQDGVIEAGEVIDDDVFIEAEHVVVDGMVNGILIVSANQAEINGTVNGDLILFVSQAKIEGTVADNLFFGGQALELNGTVGGSVFAAGSSLTLEPEAVVERNLVFGGFGLEAAEGSVVGRDVRAGGYQALLFGQVDQDVVVGTSALEIAGSIGGDVTAAVDPPNEGSTFIFQFARWPGIPEEIIPAGLRVDEEAEIAGTLTYKSAAEQADAIQSNAIGKVIYEYVPPKEKTAPTFKDWFVGRLQTFLTLFVLGALVAWRAPVLLGRTADQARAKPLPSILWGLLALCAILLGLIALVIAACILGVLFSVVTLGKLFAAILFGGSSALVLLVTLLGLLISYGTKLIVSYLIGKLILRRLVPRVAERTIWPLTLGIVLYVLVTSIPCLGDVIGFIVILVGLGAIWLLIRQSRSAPEEIFEEAPVEMPPLAEE